MTRLILALALALASPIAWANCSTSTLTTADGTLIICTMCCFAGSCNTTCTSF